MFKDRKLGIEKVEIYAIRSCSALVRLKKIAMSVFKNTET